MDVNFSEANVASWPIFAASASSTCNACLILTTCGLVVSHRNHIIYVRFFSDRKLLLALYYSIEVNF